MILVRVRDEEGRSESILGEFPPDQLDAIARAYETHNVWMLGDCKIPTTVSTQFCEADVTLGRAYFEIILTFDEK